MLLLDVNVCVYAIRQDNVDHEAYRTWAAAEKSLI
jgi:predicted nucleic acid-binding protein